MTNQESVAVLRAMRREMQENRTCAIRGGKIGEVLSKKTIGIEALTAAIDALQRQGEVRLWDSQWVNVVNHDNCYADYTTEEAIAKAVRLTEEYMRENITRGFPPPRPAGEQTPPVPKEVL